MDIKEAMSQWLSPSIYKVVLSAPEKNAPYQKAVICRIGQGYQWENHTRTQVFHQNLDYAQLGVLLEEALSSSFCQLYGWDEGHEYALKRTKKGKLLFSRRKNDQTAPAPQAQHNRQKNYLIPQGAIVPPLVDMGVFTPEGRVVKSMYDKYRQINRFVELASEQLDKLGPVDCLSVIDFGCGKSYLTFILYYYLTQVRGMQVQMLGLDLKADVIARCNQAAQKYGYHQLRFALGDINGYTPDGRVDVVIALHACDTATDYALYNAVSWGARLILSVPCCQHQLNGQMESDELSILTRFGIVQERLAALMTDAIRANLLTYRGYDTQIIEFVDIAHTPKNLLLRGVQGGVSAAARQRALAEVQRLMAAFSLSPELYNLLGPKGEK